MRIKDLAEWEREAARVIPLLHDYAARFNIPFNSDILMEQLKAKEYGVIVTFLQWLWDMLPATPDIRVQPFFDMCDLITEFPGYMDGEDK